MRKRTRVISVCAAALLALAPMVAPGATAGLAMALIYYIVLRRTPNFNLNRKLIILFGLMGGLAIVGLIVGLMGGFSIVGFGMQYISLFLLCILPDIINGVNSSILANNHKIAK